MQHVSKIISRERRPPKQPEKGEKRQKETEKGGIKNFSPKIERNGRNNSEILGGASRGATFFLKILARSIKCRSGSDARGATRASDAPLWASLGSSCRLPAVLPPSASSRSAGLLACSARPLCLASVCSPLREILPPCADPFRRLFKIVSAGQLAAFVSRILPALSGRGCAGKDKPGRCALISSGVPLPALDVLQASQGASPGVPVVSVPVVPACVQEARRRPLRRFSAVLACALPFTLSRILL